MTVPDCVWCIGQCEETRSPFGCLINHDTSQKPTAVWLSKHNSYLSLGTPHLGFKSLPKKGFPYGRSHRHGGQWADDGWLPAEIRESWGCMRHQWTSEALPGHIHLVSQQPQTIIITQCLHAHPCVSSLLPPGGVPTWLLHCDNNCRDNNQLQQVCMSHTCNNFNICFWLTASAA